MEIQAEEEGIADLREWVLKEKIKDARTDEKIMRIFLEGCKNNLDMAKKKFKNYYELRQTIPEWFECRDPMDQSVIDLLNLGVMIPMPRKDEQGRTVLIVRATVNDPQVNPMTNVFKVGMMIIDLAMERDATIAKNGVHVIIDLKGVCLGHALQMTPSLVKKAVYSWQDCYPIRIVGIDFVNCPPHVNMVLNLFRRLMREKLRKRIRTHGLEGLRLGDIIDGRCLPSEYGGSHGPVDQVIKHWAEDIQSNRKWFLDKCETQLL